MFDLFFSVVPQGLKHLSAGEARFDQGSINTLAAADGK